MNSNIVDNPQSNRASLLKPGGALLVDTGDGRHIEYDTFTCSHCGCVTILSLPLAELAGFCIDCNKLICLSCIEGKSCIPYIRKIEEQEESFYKQMQNVKMGITDRIII